MGALFDINLQYDVKNKIKSLFETQTLSFVPHTLKFLRCQSYEKCLSSYEVEYVTSIEVTRTLTKPWLSYRVLKLASIHESRTSCTICLTNTEKR